MEYEIVKSALLQKATPVKAEATQRFFKTGKGEYGEGDVFIGVSVPDTRLFAKQFADIPFTEIKKLLDSKIHEERLLGGIILVNRFKKTKDEKEHKNIFQFFIKNKNAMNNWDLVDTTAPVIIGEHCFATNSTVIMDKLLVSNRHWDRRLAILSTFAFIRHGEVALTYKYASKLLADKEDLMHKAAGWMLREAGKKDLKKLETFIQKYGSEMPRTMFRYAIEKFPKQKRQTILKQTR